MRFDVSQNLRQIVGSTTDYDLLEKATLLAEDDFAGDISGHVNFMRTDCGLLVSARLRVIVRQACSRCLTPVSSFVAVEFQEEFMPTVDVTTGERLLIAEDCDNFLIDSHQTLDLTEAVRQYSVMSAPIRPLCRPDCAGLCLRCGADLNRGPCACPPADDDLRWAVLRDIWTEVKGQRERS